MTAVKANVRVCVSCVRSSAEDFPKCSALNCVAWVAACPHGFTAKDAQDQTQFNEADVSMYNF